MSETNHSVVCFINQFNLVASLEKGWGRAHTIQFDVQI